MDLWKLAEMKKDNEGEGGVLSRWKALEDRPIHPNGVDHEGLEFAQEGKRRRSDSDGEGRVSQHTPEKGEGVPENEKKNSKKTQSPKTKSTPEGLREDRRAARDTPGGSFPPCLLPGPIGHTQAPPARSTTPYLSR